ncbi:MAG: hypothetical protein FJZ04_02070 [Candidatus Moranbacteria bacterium]|nr:hypothetical protein [Candidatus Moranbacteria bacterium]
MPNLRSSQFWQVIWRGRKIIAITTIVAVALGIFFEQYRTPSWKTTLLLTISQKEAQDTPNFKYDHYYSLEATNTLTDSLEEWLKSANLRSEIKNELAVSFKSADWRFWEDNGIKIRKKAPQIVEVAFVTDSEKNAKSLSEILDKKIKGYLESLNQGGEPYFALTNSSSAIELQVPRFFLISCLSLLWGILIGVLIVLEKENLKNSASERRKDLP